MKRKELLVIIGIGMIIGTTQPLISQNFIGGKIGGFFGTTSADVIVDALPIQWKMGTEFGLFTEFPVANKWSIIAGTQYSNRGFSLSQGTSVVMLGINLPVSARVDVNLHYIDAPILIKYTHEVGKINVYGTTGAAVGYAAKGNIETKANLIFDLNLTDTPINFSANNIGRWNTSLIAGAGVEYPVSNGKVYMDVRYNHGVNDLLGDRLIDFNVRNKGISLGFGYARAF